MSTYSETAPTRPEIDAMKGPAVVDFGTNWCGYCISARPLIDAAFTAHPDVRHIKVEDGKGRPLGRSFQIKLWPTLIFLRDGVEVSRLVRPTSEQAVRDALERIDAR